MEGTGCHDPGPPRSPLSIVRVVRNPFTTGVWGKLGCGKRRTFLAALQRSAPSRRFAVFNLVKYSVVPRNIRFGVFELDRDAAELRKQGVRVRLQDQPFQVLTYLLERPGQIVTREELKKLIWAEDTFVDFDQSLNKAVNRLREALNDDAGQPRYIETVPRRGYRFVAPVAGPDPTHECVPPALPVAVEEPRRPEPHKGGARTVRLRTTVAVAGAGVLVVLGLATWFWLRTHARAAPRTPVRITMDGLAIHPTISRDGKLLAYSSKAGGGSMHVWVRQVAGGEPLQVTRGVDDETYPDFSPDGTQIAFRSERDGGAIYTVSALGGGEPKLLAKRGSIPKFSPNGREILFFGDDVFAPGAYIVSTQGGEPSRLCPDWTASYGFWAPDGKAVLFFGGRKRDPHFGNWMLAPVAGGEPTKFYLPGDNYGDSRFPSPSAWRKSRDGREWIVFGSSSVDTCNLFRVAVSGGKLAGNPEQLTSGAGVSLQGDFSEDGSLVFTFGTFGGQIWVVPADTDRAQTRGQPEEVTHTEGILNKSPSISRDGRWLAYTAINPVTRDSSVRVRDLTTGAERQLIQNPQLELASISPDGSRVAYQQDVSKGVAGIDRSVTFLIQVAGGNPTRLCQDCDPRGFSSDGSLLLTQQGYLRNGRARAVTVRIPGGEAQDFLADDSYQLWHAFFSWDDRWVSFKIVPEEPRGKLMIAPVRNGVPAGKPEWVSVTDGKYADDKPQFSPDGNTLYFTSERDGHVCIWAQHLDRTTKRPSGAPFVVQHFHNAQWRTIENRSHSELWVARDKIVTNFRQVHGDVWMAKLD
jgi:eukaryotic-like serine/threonine-protein kinase